MNTMSFKYKIVKENLNLPPHEIKKKLREIYPEITNEEVIKLILDVNNLERMSKKINDENER